MSNRSDRSKYLTKKEIEEVLSMATVSFTKEFTIKSQSTIKKLESSIKNTTPLHIEKKDVISKRKRNEQELLDMFRSKA